MPIISTFFGIIIRMYFGDHNPPHFHVEFQGEKATFTFDGRLRSGNISSGTARKLVRDWARRHRLELMINWKNIEEGRPLNRIKPLESIYELSATGDSSASYQRLCCLSPFR